MRALFFECEELKSGYKNIYQAPSGIVFPSGGPYNNHYGACSASEFMKRKENCKTLYRINIKMKHD